MCKWTRCFWCFNGHRGFECFSGVDWSVSVVLDG